MERGDLATDFLTQSLKSFMGLLLQYYGRYLRYIFRHQHNRLFDDRKYVLQIYLQLYELDESQRSCFVTKSS